MSSTAKLTNLSLLSRAIVACAVVAGLEQSLHAELVPVPAPTAALLASFSPDALLASLTIEHQLLAQNQAINAAEARAEINARIIVLESSLLLKQRLTDNAYSSHERSKATQAAYTTLCAKITEMIRLYDNGILLASISQNKSIGLGGPGTTALHLVYASLLVRATAERATLNKFVPLTQKLLEIAAQHKESQFDTESPQRFALLQNAIQEFRDFLTSVSEGGFRHISDEAIIAVIVHTLPGEDCGANGLALEVAQVPLPNAAAGGLDTWLQHILARITARAAQDGVRKPSNLRPLAAAASTTAAAPAINNPSGGALDGGAGSGGRGAGGGAVRRLAGSYSVMEKLDFARQCGSGNHGQSCPLHGTAHSLAACDAMFHFASETSCPAAFLLKLEPNRATRNAARQTMGKSQLPAALAATN